METRDQIEAMIYEALDLGQAVSQEELEAAVSAVLAKATKHGGPGAYVNGQLDELGVSFRFKRPGLGLRESFFYPCAIEHTRVNEPAQKDKKKRTRKDDKQEAPASDAGSISAQEQAPESTAE